MPYLVHSYTPGLSWASSPFSIVGGGSNPTRPAISQPNAATTWVVNSTAEIVWDPTQVKSENGTLKSIDLFGITDKLPIANLAQNIPSTTGMTNITVPNVNNGTYRIISEFIGS